MSETPRHHHHERREPLGREKRPMSMIAGSASCTVTQQAQTTPPSCPVLVAAYGGSGMALAIMQARGPVLLASLQSAVTNAYNGPPPPYPGGFIFTPTMFTVPASLLATANTAMASAATDAGALASALVTYLVANAVATITTSTVCGRMPSSTTVGTPIEAPAAAVTLGIS